MMRTWEQLTQYANTAYASDNFSRAITLYKLALVEAEQSFNDDFYHTPQSAEAVVAATTVTFLNLAQCYIELSDYTLASAQYENAFNFMQAALIMSDISDSQRALVMRTANLIRVEWQTFHKDYCKNLSDQTYAKMLTPPIASLNSKQLAHH